MSVKGCLNKSIEDIKGIRSNHLNGVTVVFGVTGSVAVYRAIDVMRELIKRGATVKPVMSEGASHFVTHELLRWATGEKVFKDLSEGSLHVDLGVEGDVMVIAPATANFIGKLASASLDNPVLLTAGNFLGLGKKVILVPSMHYGLWNNPILKEALTKLKKAGVTVIPPLLLEGKAKFPSGDEIVSAVEALALRGQDLKGIKVLVTAGPTREWLDSVRFLTNPSSGLMGLEIARNAYFRGAKVTLVHGPLKYPVPHYIRAIPVETVDEMLSECLKEVKKGSYDAVILAAAPSDFKFSRKIEGKISSTEEVKLPTLIPSPKISKALREVFKGLMVGFAAEVSHGNINELISKAEAKMKERGFDIIVANDVSMEEAGFDSIYNEVVIIRHDRRGRELVKKSIKSFIAMKVLDTVLEELKK